MWNMIFGLIGGLGLFLVGMQMMASGMQKAAGDRLRRILEVLTTKPLMAVITGIVVTFLVQSSSTTTVMVVGFANAGIMSLTQAIGTIIGSNIGTTLTAQIISFKIDFLAMPAIGLGALLNFFGRRRFYKYIGQALLGFGLLFLGLLTMSSSMSPLKEMSAFQSMIVTFSDYPLLGVLAAAVFTALLQSSSASTGVIISLALQDMISFEAAIPLILGTNLGTCITVIIASIGVGLVARRTAAAHVFFNIFGIVVVMILLQPFSYIVQETAVTIPRQVANAHTLFNIFNSILVLIFFNHFVNLINRIIPGEEKAVERGSKFLDRRMLRTPEAAISGARLEIIRMALIANEMVGDAIDVFIKNDSKKIRHIDQMEDMVDGLEKEINFYVADLSQHSLTHEQSLTVAQLMSITNDIERIGDHAENILRLASAKIEERLPFTDEAVEEISGMAAEVIFMLDNTVTAFKEENVYLARKIIERDDIVDNMEKSLRQSHIKRINEKKCNPHSGVIFLDVISNLERVADHATNIAEAVAGEIWMRRGRYKVQGQEKY